MAKKTVMRRVLNLFRDDPGLVKVMEADDSEYTLEDAGIVPEVPKRQKLSDIAQQTDVDIPTMAPRQSDSTDTESESQQQPASKSSLPPIVDWLDKNGIEHGTQNPEGTIVAVELKNNRKLLICDVEPGLVNDSMSVVMASDEDALTQVMNVIANDRKKR